MRRTFLLALWGAELVGADVPSRKLGNGVEMPVLAFAANVWDAATCRKATGEALEAGFRFVWSSALVGADCQKAQAEAVAASGLPRSELFIAGTVNNPGCGSGESCYQQTKNLSEEQFQTLGEKSLDMLMLDYPASSGCEGILGQWRAFEEFYAAKRVRSIAVSNFNPEMLDCILANKTAVVPAVNQMPYSLGHASDPVVSDDSKRGIVVQAYSPLGSGNIARDELCATTGKAHGKTAAQVALKWILQHDVTIATQSTSAAHMKEDIEIFDFELSASEMSQLDARTPGMALIL